MNQPRSLLQLLQRRCVGVGCNGNRELAIGPLSRKTKYDPSDGVSVPLLHKSDGKLASNERGPGRGREGRDFTIDVIFEQMHVLQSSIPITCKNLGGKLSPQGADVELGVARLRKGSEKRVLRAIKQHMSNQDRGGQNKRT